MDNLARKWSRQLSIEQSALASKPELQRLAESLLRTLAASGVAIAYQEQGGENPLTCTVSVGRAAPPLGARLDPNSGISGRCIREARTQRSYDTRLDPRVEASVCERLGIRSLAAAPMLGANRCIGLIEAFSPWPGHFDDEKISAIEQAAESAALLLVGQSSAPIDAQQQRPEFVSEAPQPQLTLVQEIPEVRDQNLATKNSEVAPGPSATTLEDSVVAAEDAHREEEPTAPNFLPEERRFFLREERRRWPQPWALGGALAMIVVVALFAAGGLLRARVHGPDSRRALAPQIQPMQPSSANLPAPAKNDGNVRTTAPTTPTPADQPSDDFLLLAQRAKDGDPTAQVDLAQAYLTGDEVPADNAKAASWYIMAGQNGNSEAKRKAVDVTRGMTAFQIAEVRFDLGKMYEQGIGSPRDLVSAYMWLELAKASGDIRAPGEESRLEKKMKSAQVEEARSRAASWLQSHARVKNR